MGIARKKPVEIEFVRLEPTEKSILQAYRFIHGHDSVRLNSYIDHDKWEDYAKAIMNTGLEIKTLEGTLKAIPGKCVIIKGVKGEFYPCDNEIFANTYDIIEE